MSKSRVATDPEIAAAISKAQKAHELSGRKIDEHAFSKGDSEMLGNLCMAIGAELGAVVRLAKGLIDSQNCTDPMRLQAAKLVLSSAREHNKLIDNAIKMGIKVPDAPKEQFAAAPPEF
jgi:hypothetical protein